MTVLSKNNKCIKPREKHTKWVDLCDFHLQAKTQLNKLLVAEQHLEEKSVCMRYLIMKNTFTALQRSGHWETGGLTASETSLTSPACGCSSWQFMFFRIHEFAFFFISWIFGQINTFIWQCWENMSQKNIARSHFIAKTKAKNYYNYKKAYFKAKQICKNLVLYYFQELYRFPPKFT